MTESTSETLVPPSFLICCGACLRMSTVLALSGWSATSPTWTTRSTRAADRGVPISKVTDETAAWFREDVAALGALPPHSEPRATAHIDGMVRMIRRIVENGHAYVSGGHVFFDVASDPESGALFRAGMRGAPADDGPDRGKRSPADFVLWKPSGADQPSWPSPWGPGVPAGT